MSKIKPIKSLSKEELLNLFYHLVPTTVFTNHPCLCVVCGDLPVVGKKILVKENGKPLLGRTSKDKFKKLHKVYAKVYGYICDKCEADNFDTGVGK